MRKARLIWQIYPSYLVITIVSIIVVMGFASGTMKRFHLSETAKELESAARIILEQNRTDFLNSDASMVDRLCKQLGEAGNLRITVISASGAVLGDSEEDPTQMENHSDRPEVRQALAGERGLATRFSYTLGAPMMYVAVPLSGSAGTVGVVRTSIPVSAIDSALNTIYRRITLAGLIIALLTAGVSYWISRRIIRPLEELKEGAERFARGDFSKRLPLLYSQEFNALADAMNHMAGELDFRIQAIVRQKNQEEAILAGMAEGVLAVDMKEQVIMLNRATARMFSIDETGSNGKSLQEVIRNPKLHEMVSRVLSDESPIEGKLDPGVGESVVYAYGTALKDQNGERIGALMMLRDMTHVSKLERIRKDFVSNVSHELKTPVTSIKGFVETLLQSGRKDPRETSHFLKIIEKHTDRLNAIIEDLLTLSRIEQEAENTQIRLETEDIKSVLDAAVESCRVSASSRDIRISLTTADPCRAKVNAPLLEQAVVNLLDNAIKYSEPGGVVEVTGELRGDEVIIKVKDAGCGIAEMHMPRIFERFYQVDKAKSRSLGGTGLGLAIAKHIVFGEGSTFTIHLPAR
jgi:two-component system phosphate regulon sensor histidine kinase PhoR